MKFAEAISLFCVFISIFLSQEAFASQMQPSPDFFVKATSEGMLPKNLPRQPLRQRNEENCRAHIKPIMCLVEPRKADEIRECLPGSAAYATVFEELHDQFPQALQKVFCSLDVIYIEKQFEGTAYAGSSKDRSATIMGVRQSVLDEQLSLNTWASWKEQLSFGGDSGSYKVSPVLPVIETSETPQVNSFLYFLVAHEFGHILDFSNGVNAVVDTCVPKEDEDTWPPNCYFKPNTWGDISWEAADRVRPETDFAHRTELCFYWCGDQTLSPVVIPKVYEDLMQSQFISTYGSRQAWDDFADSLAYYAMDQNLNLTYILDTRQGARHDIMAKLKSPVFRKKYEYLKTFIERTDIVYP